MEVWPLRSAKSILWLLLLLILEEKGKRLQQTAEIPPKPATFSVQPRSSCLLQKGLALQACRLYSRDPWSRFISSKGNWTHETIVYGLVLKEKIKTGT